jgi:signal transduction histidine kinase
MVGEVLQNLRTSIDLSNAEIIVNNEVKYIRGDKIQLSQLFQNLISNGIKFTKNTRPEIVITGKTQDDHSYFSVSDNGIGIAPENLGKVFDLFRRLHSRKEFPGTGIGLSICKKIIERHNGKIWIESEKDKGTTFHFTIGLDE